MSVTKVKTKNPDVIFIPAYYEDGSTEPAKIKDALATTKGLQVVTGMLDMDDNHNPIKRVVVNEYNNGKQALKEIMNS